MGSVEMRQLLFDGTYVVGVQGIKHFLEIADNVLEKTQLEVERIIVESYVGALAAIANVEILERNITDTFIKMLKRRISFLNQVLVKKKVLSNFALHMFLLVTNWITQKIWLN